MDYEPYCRFFTTKNSNLPSNQIWNIVVDGQNRKWIGTQQGIATLLEDDWVIYNKKNTPLKTNTIKSIIYDNYDRVWVASEKGIVSYDGERWKKHKINNKNLFITSLFVDNFDNKWVCTSKNIIVYNVDGVEFKSNVTINNSVIVSKQ